MVMTWSMSASTSTSRVWGYKAAPDRQVASDGEDGIERVVRRSRRRISVLTATLAADDGHEKLPADGQIAARWRP